MNSPYLSNNQKEIYNKDKPVYVPQNTGQPSSGPSGKPNDKLLVDLQVYQEQKKNPLVDKQVTMPIQPIALSNPYVPPQFQSYLNNFMKNFYTPFIYKDYNINIGGPNANHTTAAMLYEDALPPADVYTSYKTLKERISLCDYVRSTFLHTEDGERTDFSGGPNSLNARLKLIELNPFNTNAYSSNPYKGLPKDLLIYRSCYPITYDQKNATAQCQKSSVGINMRTYRITKEEYQAKHQLLTKKTKNPFDDPDINSNFKETIPKPVPGKEPLNYNVWREIEYYAYIRNEILKTLVSPNFISSYCYFLFYNANISFERNKKIFGPTENIPVNNIDSNIAVIILTESPNYNIYAWASDTYTSNRNIHKQIYSGYKSENIWKTIIIQMLFSFYVMYKKSFTFTSMEIDKNFYVKDINSSVDTKQFWKYKIDNIDYYIPNYGHLLMVDHDYHDLDIEESKNNNKVIGKFLNNDVSKVQEKVIHNARKCLDPNNFTQKFKNTGGVAPSENVKTLLQQINDDLRNGVNFKEIIITRCINYVHNRVGTPIRDSEVDYIRKSDIRPYKKGELVIYEEKYGTYKIVLYVENVDEENITAITRDNLAPDSRDYKYVINKYPKDLIYHYSENEIIKQDSVPGEPSLNLDYLLETYII